jgi:hypothetical protein
MATTLLDGRDAVFLGDEEFRPRLVIQGHLFKRVPYSCNMAPSYVLAIS